MAKQFNSSSNDNNNLRAYQKDMIKSGLNWKVEKRPLFDERGNELRISGTFRSDNDFFLGAVTPNYTVVDNVELFRYPEKLIEAGENIKFAGAGTLNGGEGVFVRYKLPHVIDVKKEGDIIETELIVSTKHNGKGSVVNAVNSKRLVCTNGMTTSDKRLISNVRHSHSASDRLADARRAVVFIGEQVRNFEKLVDAFARVQLTMKDIGEIVTAFYYKDDNSNLLTSSIKQNQARMILSIFEVNDDNAFKSQRGTAWNLLNAFTNFADHRLNYRAGHDETDEQAAMRGKLFGAGQALKFRALQSIAQVVAKKYGVNIPENLRSL